MNFLFILKILMVILGINLIIIIIMSIIGFYISFKKFNN